MARPSLKSWNIAAAGLLATAGSIVTTVPNAYGQDATERQTSAHVEPAQQDEQSSATLAFATSSSRSTNTATPSGPDTEEVTRETEAEQELAPYYEFRFDTNNTDEDFNLLEVTGLTEDGPSDPRLQGATIAITFLRGGDDPSGNDRYQLGVNNIGFSSMREGTQRPIAHYIIDLSAPTDSDKPADMFLYKQFHDLNQNNHLSIPEGDELRGRLPYTRVYTGLMDEDGQRQFYDYSVTERFENDPNVQNGSPLSLQERRRNAERIIAEINTHADQVRQHENMLANAERNGGPVLARNDNPPPAEPANP